MPKTSRRSFMTAVAAASAAPLIAPAQTARAAPARAAGAAHASAVPLSAAGGGSAGFITLAANDPAAHSALSLGNLVAGPPAGDPERTEITHGGTTVAVLTKGARTVLVRGPERRFQETGRVFTDVFDRTNAEKWGSVPGGGSWTHVNGRDGSPSAPPGSDYGVTPAAAYLMISTTAPTTARHTTLVDDGITDFDARATARFDKAPSGATVSYALSFGYQNTKNHFRARLSFSPQDGGRLRLEKEAADQVSELGGPHSLGVAASAAAEPWHIRVVREGRVVRARAWQAGTAEPAAWQLWAEDAAFPKGRVGVRAAAGAGLAGLPVKLLVSEFTVVSAAPAVTHREWVRVLPAPYDGTWTSAVEERVRGWAGSTAPDALAHAAMFLKGVPPVTSARPGEDLGRPVLGAAGYSPLVNGVRDEGADFHEYSGVSWTFPPDNRVWTADPAFAGHLDCSGYVRMVYGRHMGVPMTYFGGPVTGEYLPRDSAAMARNSPGVRIAHAAAAPPPLAGLHIGDLLFFDAVTDADDKIDHVAIHLGVDEFGARRFLSSRKTPNGPTAADLGGASTIDGTGTYAETLRTIRRL
ncbi:NlpC/P60 family protein [Streptomyces sp. NPDC014894]|uniref:NlpC/P60 family protein n=1 Tax=Streptomyces sp. NPDC014894 TaxID=3364931 RepID=UPI0036FBDCA2